MCTPPDNGNKYISGKDVYRLYLMLKLHFKGQKDVVKSNWKIKVSDKAYDSRKDKYIFEKLSEKFQLKVITLILIGSLVENPKTWIGDLSIGEIDVEYKRYINRLKMVEHRFIDDVKSIKYLAERSNKTLHDAMIYNSNSKTSLVFELLQKRLISFETFIMLDGLFDIINKHDNDPNIIWLSQSNSLKGYKKLFIPDLDDCQRLFESVS